MNHVSAASKRFCITHEMLHVSNPHRRIEQIQHFNILCLVDIVMLELVKIDLFMLNASLLNAILCFISQSGFPSAVRKLPR